MHLVYIYHLLVVLKDTSPFLDMHQIIFTHGSSQTISDLTAILPFLI